MRPIDFSSGFARAAESKELLRINQTGRAAVLFRCNSAGSIGQQMIWLRQIGDDKFAPLAAAHERLDDGLKRAGNNARP